MVHNALVRPQCPSLSGEARYSRRAQLFLLSGPAVSARLRRVVR